MIQQKKVDELFPRNSRASKKEARSLINGAWKSHVRKNCFNVALATSFLKHPPVAVDDLLAAWVKFMSSKEFASEKARSAKIGDAPAEAEKIRRDELKMKVYKLRHLRRHMVALLKRISEGSIQSIPVSQKGQFRKVFEWGSGCRARCLDD